MVVIYAIRTATTVTDNNGTRFTYDGNDTVSLSALTGSSSSMDPFTPPTLNDLVDTSFPLDADNVTASELLGIFSPVFATEFLTTGKGYSMLVQCNPDWLNPFLENIVTNASKLEKLVEFAVNAVKSQNQTLIDESVKEIRASPQLHDYIVYVPLPVL